MGARMVRAYRRDSRRFPESACDRLCDARRRRIAPTPPRARRSVRDDRARRRLSSRALEIIAPPGLGLVRSWARSEEHTSELQSLMRISYAVFCLKKKKKIHNK